MLTKKLNEGMKREFEQTEATLTYQLGKSEQATQQLKRQLTETSQVHQEKAALELKVKSLQGEC